MIILEAALIDINGVDNIFEIPFSILQCNSRALQTLTPK